MAIELVCLAHFMDVWKMNQLSDGKARTEDQLQFLRDNVFQALALYWEGEHPDHGNGIYLVHSTPASERLARENEHVLRCDRAIRRPYFLSLTCDLFPVWLL